ncbi:MAG: GTPase, partial [Planctomycetes bacterium]|nr:GTPase [Planctomycetota bacterium]
LHFQEDDLLRKTIFLKPNWATSAVYKILDHQLLNQKRGRFNKADANIIWHEEIYADIRPELLRLMQKFFLTYEINNSGDYIVPERLPGKQPKYEWEANDNLFLCYDYDVFMPQGILSQLTVEMNHHIANHAYVWRRGVVLERQNTRAEIVGSYDARTLTIRLKGQNRRDFMTLISEQVEQINAQYKKMKVNKLIPCHCAVCKAARQPYFYKYHHLKRRMERGRHEVECEESYEMVNVRALIDDVLNPASRPAEAREMEFERPYHPPKKVKRDKVFVSY